MRPQINNVVEDNRIPMRKEKLRVKKKNTLSRRRQENISKKVSKNCIYDNKMVDNRTIESTIKRRERRIMIRNTKLNDIRNQLSEGINNRIESTKKIVQIDY